MTNTLSSQAIKLLLSNVFYRAWNSTRRIFLNIYIFKFIGNIQLLALFSISMLSFHFIWFLIAAIIVKKWYRNILSVSSIWAMALLFLLLAYDIDIIQDYYFLLSIAMWVSSWVYWSVCNHNQFDLTVPKNRWNFEGWKKTLRTINSLVTPILIGYIISVNAGEEGYIYAFILGALFFVISAYFSIIDESKLHITDVRFSMWELFSKISWNKNIISIIFIVFLTGFALSTNVIEVIAPIVLTHVGVNELWVGIFVSIISLISIISSYIFWKYVDYKHYKLSYFVAWIVYLILILLLLAFPGQLFFTVFVTLIALLYVFMDIPTTVFTSNYLHEFKGYKYIKSEYLVLREFATILWRIVTFIPIFFIASFDIQNLTIIFVTMAFAIFISMILFIQLRIPKHD